MPMAMGIMTSMIGNENSRTLKENNISTMKRMSSRGKKSFRSLHFFLYNRKANSKGEPR